MTNILGRIVVDIPAIDRLVSLLETKKQVIEIPALDRLLDYLEGSQQSQIDSLKEQVTELTESLKLHRTPLSEALEKETLPNA